MPRPEQLPYSISIFVPDGDPNGLREVQKWDWTGIGLVFSRTIYHRSRNQAEFSKTGVYVLVGPSEESSLPMIYVGEGDSVRGRLDRHSKEKDFWTEAVFFVSKDDSLNKAHVKYLESRLIELAKAAKQSKLDNEKKSQPYTLSKVEKTNAEDFLRHMLSIFPLLGLNIFEKAEEIQKPPNLLYLKAKGIEATGYEDARGFVVRKDSQLAKAEVPSLLQHAPNVVAIRKDLLEQEVLSEREEHNVFAEDYVFPSPSSAAAVLLGRSENGRTAWKNAAGKTLKDLQTAATGQEEEDNS